MVSLVLLFHYKSNKKLVVFNIVLAKFNESKLNNHKIAVPQAANRTKKVARKSMIYGLLVLEAGIEPARTFLSTGF